jgi:2-oxoglutarate dehydrogenase E2 component (dihydrolipoamide succinyltransferase)
MKSCPLCNRKYSDQDFNYCPADGSILSSSTISHPSTSSQSGEISSPVQYILEDVILPRLGDAVSKATITKWHKNVGEAVKCDEPLYDISTSKVDAEVPSPYSGILFEIRVPAGQTVPVNTVIARIRRSKNSE